MLEMTNLKKQNNYGQLSEHRSFLMGIAAVFVILHHSATMTDSSFDIHIINIIRHIFSADFNIGVEIFLLLSGAGLYFSLSKKNFSFKQYYAKRLVNVYLMTLLVNLPYCIYSNFISEQIGILNFLLEWSTLSMWFSQVRTGWYISLAMILYLVYPIIFKIMKQLDSFVPEKFEVPLLTLIVLIVFAICQFMKTVIPNFFQNAEIALLRIPVFIIGCYLGKLMYNKKRFGMRTILFTLLGILIWVAVKLKFGSTFMLRFSHCLLAFSICIVLIYIVELVRIKPFYSFFKYLGSMSLEIYLVHSVLAKAVCQLNGFRYVSVYCVLIVVSFIVSIFLSKLRYFLVKRIG